MCSFCLFFLALVFSPSQALPSCPQTYQDRCLTWPHSGLLSLISRTKISTSVVAWNFPSEAITLRRYFSVSSLSRGFLEEIVHSPSIWLTWNCPSVSPSGRGKRREMGIFHASPVGELKDWQWWHRKGTAITAVRRGVVGPPRCTAAKYPAHFCYALSITLGRWMGWKEETAPNCKNVFVMFCRHAYSLLQNHIFSLS